MYLFIIPVKFHIIQKLVVLSYDFYQKLIAFVFFLFFG